jgi:hypothetical protein
MQKCRNAKISKEDAGTISDVRFVVTWRHQYYTGLMEVVTRGEEIDEPMNQ